MQYMKIESYCSKAELAEALAAAGSEKECGDRAKRFAAMPAEKL